MLEEIDEGFIGLDWEYRQVHVNETACRMVGRTTDELLGRTPCQVWPELAGSEVERSCRQAMELGRPSTVEHAIGAERWFELRVYPTAIGVSVYLRDVSERKRKEAERDRYLAELRESEARSELLAHVASELLSSDDPQGLIEELCRQVMAHLDCQAFLNFVADGEAGRLHLNAYAGIRDDEAQGIEWLDYGARISGLVARDRVRLVIEKIGATSDARTDLLASYGLRAFACHPLLSQGRVLGTLAFGTRTRDHFSDDDLSLMATVADHVAIAMARNGRGRSSERSHESRRRHQATEERYRRLFESMQEPFYLAQTICDGEGHVVDFRYLEANPAFTRMMGRELDDLLGKRAYDLVPDLDPAWIDVLGQVSMSGEARRFCHYSATFETDLRDLRLSHRRRLRRVVVTDATEREAAQREREELVARLQRQGDELQARTAALHAQALELRAQADLARRQTALADALNTIDGLIHSTHDFDEIMRRALEQGARALGADAGTIEVREDSSWVVHYQYGFSADEVGLRQSEADAPSATRAWATMQPVPSATLPRTNR